MVLVSSWQAGCCCAAVPLCRCAAAPLCRCCWTQVCRSSTHDHTHTHTHTHTHRHTHTHTDTRMHTRARTTHACKCSGDTKIEAAVDREEDGWSTAGGAGGAKGMGGVFVGEG